MLHTFAALVQNKPDVLTHTLPATRAPKARPIPAWGNAPCTTRHKSKGLKARPIDHLLIPYIPLIEGNTILHQQRPKLSLEVPLAVMRLLRIDVRQQGLQIHRSNRKRPVPALPCEFGQRRRLPFKPSRRRGLQLFNQCGEVHRARKTYSQMHMIGNTANSITFTPCITGDRRKIGVQRWTDRLVENRPALPGAEHNMDQQKRERQGHTGDHKSGFWAANIPQTRDAARVESRRFTGMFDIIGRSYRTGLQPSASSRFSTWGVAPCWYETRRWRWHPARMNPASKPLTPPPAP